jgi:hypothetical protein
MFYPEDGTLEIEFRFRGQDVTIGGTDETGDGKTRKELPLSRIPNRQARPNLLRWQHFWYSAEWSSDEEIAHHWKNLVDIYLFMIETVLDKLVQKRECN